MIARVSTGQGHAGTVEVRELGPGSSGTTTSCHIRRLGTEVLSNTVHNK
jgi:hypothetical protein